MPAAQTYSRVPDGGEPRVVAAFYAWLAAHGRDVSTEVDFCESLRGIERASKILAARTTEDGLT